jgi:transposase
MVLDLTAQLDRESAARHKVETILRELIEARRNRKSEQLSADQLALFAAVWEARQKRESGDSEEGPKDPDNDPKTKPDSSPQKKTKNGGGRQPLSPNLKRERIVHDWPDVEKHCAVCAQDLRPIGEESSERYEYIPAQLVVIEDVCKKYVCECTVRTATKPPQPIEKSTAGASLLAEGIVAKTADHVPLHRQRRSSSVMEWRSRVRRWVGGWDRWPA